MRANKLPARAALTDGSGNDTSGTAGSIHRRRRHVDPARARELSLTAACMHACKVRPLRGRERFDRKPAGTG